MDITPPHDIQNEIPGRRTTRSALAEIPARLGMMTMQDIGHDIMMVTAVNNNTTTPGNPRTGLWNMSLNLPSSLLSPSPSPDELVIQSRGRRRVPVIWSPDIDHKKPAPTNRTPVKRDSPGKSTIVLRSTPRKRLLMNDPKELFPTPEKRTKSPSAKKVRLENYGYFEGPLEDGLKGLSQEQLIAVIQDIVANNPQLEQVIKSSLPAPDIRPLEERLNYLKKNIFKSLPNSRLTSKTDSPAYSRAAQHLVAFKKCVLEQGRQLVESQHWCSVMDYALLAWSYVKATPLWDNPPHNTARKQCFKSLASQLMTAIKKGSFTDEQLQDLEKKLEDCVADSEDIPACLKHLSALRSDV